MGRRLKKVLIGFSLPLAMVGVAIPLEIAALIGRPATPLSVAGVARRTTRRVVVAETATVTATSAASAQASAEAAAASAQASAAEAASASGAPAEGSVVYSLPAGCTAVTKDGVEYQVCGGVFYRAAFQGSNLVYVVTQP